MIALKLQFKNIMRDKFVLMSMLLPIILAIILKSYTPNVAIEPQVAILKDNLSNDTIAIIERIAVVEKYSNIVQLESRILETKNEVIGVVFDSATDHFKYMIQGNETTRIKTDLQILASLVKGDIGLDEVETEILPHDNNDMHCFLITVTVLMALYMGCAFNAFNIVAEKEEGITNINQILPMPINMYIFQKAILGFIGSVIVTTITVLIATHDINWGLFLVFSVISSFSASIVGLYLGLISNDLISVIINTKVILLVFLFVPVIGFMMPTDLVIVKVLLYLVPSFPIFEGLWAILRDGDISRMLINTGIVGVHTVLAYLLYYLLSRKNIRSYGAKA